MNHVLDGDLDLPMGRGNSYGMCGTIKALRDSGVSCAKMAEPIEIPYGGLTLMGSENHVLEGGHQS